MAALAGMTWRRFLVLLAGLSRDSRWALWASTDGQVINDPDAAERAVDAALS